ncbi:DUF1552 domain-containing protein [Pseudobacteriovorax antillogorgiicola]|uniref:DUF1552 domain-containing protein n=1 Tax=Pseudobacteriovorax antillogorgiicola TaxID=1513793 RepID=A0A1Y6BFS7_9BACT|nr:DUF1552 domain-containing protein [Pseudobacteriovorax antillogorgiicola]TCS57384.1 uncharacterized protein DUF1552 [Pseudobacteriovorax antillogorgiicola]SMF01779.1 Protein of unknown function [Pseudobacteriovorax antillogorgiicola]
MILKNRSLDRRTLLRGIANGSMVALGLPMLEMMLNSNGDALANGEGLPQRFVMFYFGCGVSNNFFPTTTGAGFTLTPSMQGLASFANQLNIVSGLSVTNPGIDPHAAKYYMQLSGSSPRTEKHNYSTIDQYIAGKISTNQTYESIQLRVSNSVDSDGIVPSSDILSYRKPSADIDPLPLAAEIDPASAFNRLFGQVPDKNEYLTKISLMNALKEDTKRLMNKVSQKDKHIIEEYFANVNDLAKIIDDKQNKSCDQLAVNPSQAIDNDDLDERMRVMSSITSNLFKCDMTRVVSILHSAPASNQIYPTISDQLHHHELTHREDAERLSGITGIIMNQLGMLASSLAGVVEGESNLLDQTLIYGVTEETFPSHRFTNLPTILLGGAGNSAYKKGIHNDAGGASPVRSALTVFKALGIDSSDWQHDDENVQNDSGHFTEFF